MKLYHLCLIPEKFPWPLYDCMLSLIVRAEDEQQAREIAQEKAVDEADCHPSRTPWLDPE